MATPRSVGAATPTTSYSAASVPPESTLPSEVGSKAGDDFASNLANYIFHEGYYGQQWADVHLFFFNSSLKLHRLILARSPYLAHLLMDSMPGSTLQLAFTDDNITEEAVFIAIQDLYSPANGLVTPSNARAVLATAYLFRSPALVQRAYDVCASSLSAENVGQYVAWLDQRIPNGANGFTADYGEYASRLRSDVVNFLIRTLPTSVGPKSPALVDAYAALPYELFKSCVESPDLPIEAMQERFAFAKKVVAARKKGAAASGMEESVVLAVKDDGDGMGVHVTRKPKRARQLWKVEG